MTSISSLSSATSASLYSATSSTTKHKSAIDVAASLFGMSTDDVKSELKSGKSLNDLAKEKGVSTDDLDNALVANMPASMSSSGNASEIAQKIASRTGLPEGHGGRHHHTTESATDTTSTTTTASTSTDSQQGSLLDVSA